MPPPPPPILLLSTEEEGEAEEEAEGKVEEEAEEEVEEEVDSGTALLVPTVRVRVAVWVAVSNEWVGASELRVPCLPWMLMDSTGLLEELEDEDEDEGIAEEE